jgi:hypothetical protein
MTYNLSLTDREFRIVTMGLAGKIEEEEDVAEALKLNTQLCHQRLVMIEQAKRESEKALEHASTLENPNVPPRKK